MAEKTVLSMTIKPQLTTKQDKVPTLDVTGRLAASILGTVGTSRATILWLQRFCAH